MKNYVQTLLHAAFSSFLFVVTAEAALIDNGNGTVTDTINCKMWLQDMNYAETSGFSGTSPRGLRWDRANDWANNLVFPESNGYSDWRLPSAEGAVCMGAHCFDTELAWLYNRELGNFGTSGNNFGPFTNFPGIFHWTAPKVPPGPDTTCPEVAWFFQFSGLGLQGQACTTSYHIAWPVRDISGCSPPECADGIDNDNDGLIDTTDSDCISRDDSSERPSICWTNPITGVTACLERLYVLLYLALAFAAAAALPTWLYYRKKKS